VRILVWQELFWPHIGGIEVLATKLFSNLRQRGHEIALVTRRDRLHLAAEEQYEGVQVYRHPFWTALTSRNVEQIIQIRQKIARLKREFQPDVIHMNSFGPSFLFHHDTISAHPAPLIATVHTMSRSVMSEGALHQTGLFKRTLRLANWVVGVSAAVLEQTREMAPEITPHSGVLYNGVNVPPAAPKPLNFDAAKIFIVGRLIPEKAADVALRAFAMITTVFPAARLVLAGDGPERSSLEKLAFGLGLTDSVEFVGLVPPAGIPALLNGATAVVIPSYREGLPSVALEASLMGRPIIASRVGGLPEVVLDGKTGLLVPPGDHEALAKAILFLLKNPRIATDYGAAGRQWVQKTFDFERYVSGYDELYGKIAGQIPCVASA
jgi:glycosyltransferase involved in cell wall biosynthesis